MYMQQPYDPDDGFLPQNAISQIYGHTDKASNMMCFTTCYITSCELNSIGHYKVLCFLLVVQDTNCTCI